MTLQVAAVVLARLGEAEPAAVLSGAFSAHFPPDISPVPGDDRMEISEAQSLARQALGEAAYSAALGRGAAMDEDEGRWLRAGRVQAARRLARRTRRAGIGITAKPGAAEQPGMTGPAVTVTPRVYRLQGAQWIDTMATNERPMPGSEKNRSRHL